MTRSKPWERSYPESLRGYQIEPAVLQGSAVDFAIAGARQHDCKPAFTLVLANGMQTSLSFAQLDEMSDAFARYLVGELGLAMGEVVAIQLPNSLHYPVAVMGAWKAGLTVTNVNPLYTAHELEYQLMDSGAKVLLASDLFVQAAEPVVQRLGIGLLVASLGDFFGVVPGWLIRRKLAATTQAPSIAHLRFVEALRIGRQVPPMAHRQHPIALYQYTGGTTGRSKGAVLSHANLLAVMQMAESMIAASGIELKAGDTVLTALPMYHIFAFNFNFLLGFRQGARNLLIPNPRPLSNLEPAFRKFSVQLMTGVDTLFAGLLAQPWFKARPPSLKLAISGGTALRPSTAELWQNTVSPIVEGYGLTESSCFVSFNPPNELARLGTVGLPLPGSDVRIVDEQGNTLPLGQPGELLVRGPNIMVGYLNRPEETAAAVIDGWFYTGDIAQMDNDGYIRIVDRKKDMILVSGFNVYPNEIEAVIAAHPQVSEVAVIGVLDEVTGEAIRAFITPREAGLDSDEIIRHCRERLTGYKVPRQIILREQLPKSPVGKILRAQLRAEG